MFRKPLLLLMLLAFSVTAFAQAGSVREVWNKTWSQSTAVPPTVLVTSTADSDYLVAVYENMVGRPATCGTGDSASPYMIWTDDLGEQKIGDGAGASLGATIPILDIRYPTCGGAPDTNAGPFSVLFPVHLRSNARLTLTVPVSNPDNLIYHLSVQVLQIQGW